MLKRYICTNISRKFRISDNVIKTVPSMSVRQNFSNEEEKKILDAVNNLKTDELTKFSLSKARAQKVVLWKSKHGSFKNLDQILELDGFGQKVLQKFCKAIIDGKSKSSNSSQDQAMQEITRKIHHYCNPHLGEKVRTEIKSCLGVNVQSGNISWAKLSIHENEPLKIDTWNDHKIDDRKLHLADLAILIKQICTEMPVADCYVFESPISAQPSLPGKNVMQLNVNIQRSQLTGMTALGLLYKEQETVNSSCDEQKVFFVRNFLPSRLFRTKIGNERISNENVVLNILRYHYNTDENCDVNVQNESSLEQVNASYDVREKYDKVEPYQRDLIGQAFLNALTFVRVCVQKSQTHLKRLEVKSS